MITIDISSKKAVESLINEVKFSIRQLLSEQQPTGLRSWLFLNILYKSLNVLYIYQRSFKFCVIGSIIYDSTGPTPNTVLLPDLICVFPASSTKKLLIFFLSRSYLNFYNSLVESTFTTIFAQPKDYHPLSKVYLSLWNLASSCIWR